MPTLLTSLCSTLSAYALSQWPECVAAHLCRFLRYHYNVAHTRVAQHVEKGVEDGLYMSSVGCCQDLWAVIMDAGTGFTAQVYNLSATFLPKVGGWVVDRVSECWCRT